MQSCDLQIETYLYDHANNQSSLKMNSFFRLRDRIDGRNIVEIILARPFFESSVFLDSGF